jgi:addiction module HigA family antidote
MAKDFVHPGQLLREELMEPSGLTEAALAQALDVPLGRVERLLDGHEGVTIDLAIKLAKALRMKPEFWLVIQSKYNAMVVTEILSRPPVGPVVSLAESRRLSPDGVQPTPTGE